MKSHEDVRGDLDRLLQREGVSARTMPGDSSEKLPAAHGTTVIAMKYDQGVLNVADRRATAASSILYNEAEKILVLDEHTLIAIAGSYAQAAEAARFLRHSFKYYARSQLQEMSLQGKLAEVSDRKSTRLNSSHSRASRMPSSA